MRYLKYLVLLLALLALPALDSQAQVAVRIGVNIGPSYGIYHAPPVCEWGFYPTYPFGCAPYGYYGPEWFVDGVFIGAGPWYNFYYVRPTYYRPYYFHHGFRRIERVEIVRPVRVRRVDYVRFHDHDRGFREREFRGHDFDRGHRFHEFHDREFRNHEFRDHGHGWGRGHEGGNGHGRGHGRRD